jgi:hypothetical protein
MKQKILLLFCILLANPNSLFAEQKGFSIAVVGAEKNDSRFVAVKEAITFWNQELDKLGVNIRFEPVTHLIEPDIDDALLQLINAKGFQQRRKSLMRFKHISGDILIVLSNSDIISFAMTGLKNRKGLIGIRRADVVPLSLPNVSRNVIAQEIGHVLGLQHNGDSTKLMCGRPSACRPYSFGSDKDYIFPLTELDKKRLRKLQW